jgi:ABC-type uncharacterized transport system YnjBCD ATPase subunit
VLGVSGPTGAGKTTFADLLIGLMEPDAGEITVGGTPLRGTTAVTWRDHVSYVVQDPYLYRDTIRRNLLWANPQATDAEIWNALAVACADEFVLSLKSGLETVLGERGTLISGGERQRLCLARAVLRRPWLFVLDEATRRARCCDRSQNSQPDCQSRPASDHRDDRAPRPESGLLRSYRSFAKRPIYNRRTCACALNRAHKFKVKCLIDALAIPSECLNLLGCRARWVKDPELEHAIVSN